MDIVKVILVILVVILLTGILAQCKKYGGFVGASDDAVINISPCQKVINNSIPEKMEWPYEQDERPRLIYFYRPDCPWCLRFNSTWEQITKNKWVKERIITGQVDCTDPKNTDICKRYGVMTVPSIYLETFGRNNTPIRVKFSGDEKERTVKCFTEFIKKFTHRNRLVRARINRGTPVW